MRPLILLISQQQMPLLHQTALCQATPRQATQGLINRPAQSVPHVSSPHLPLPQLLLLIQLLPLKWQ